MIRIAVTAGEPAGVGPELCLQLPQIKGVEWVYIADPNLLRAHAKSPPSKALSIEPIALAQPATPGQLNAANAAYVLATLERAARGCLSGEFAAVVTGPVHKGIINDAGYAFSGHTEFFAELAQSDPVMLLAAGALRVALATTHVPLSSVPALITDDNLTRVIKILHHDLHTKFSIPAPRILILGLNPHAGEGGHMGTQERDIITPTLDRLRAQGLDLHGPASADTAFLQATDYDAVLAMYHDQGLPVLKYAGFGKAVNITLGLPFIRTSVDHGTALDLAGMHRADAGSFIAAAELAAQLAQGT